MGDPKEKEFWQTFFSLRRANPQWRYGQVVFNAAYEVYPERVDSTRGSKVDPFYNDNRVKEFLEVILGEPDEV